MQRTTDLPNPEHMAPDQLFAIVNAEPFVKSWLEHVKDAAKAAMRDGHVNPGHKLVKPHSRSAWLANTAPRRIAEHLANQAGLDVHALYQLVGISEARDKMVAGLRERGYAGDEAKSLAESALAIVTSKVELKGYQIAKETDKRPDASAMAAFRGVSVPSIE